MIDLNGDFLAKGYNEGARISSNSWAANNLGGYGQLSSIVDEYVWSHKDYLMLYAAGNAGPGPQTIGSPGTAKNVLTVGASENNRLDQGNESDNPDTMTDAIWYPLAFPNVLDSSGPSYLEFLVDVFDQDPGLPAPYAQFATTLGVNARSNVTSNIIAQVKIYT